MDLAPSKKGENRVEFRVSNEDKELFEYARQISGFKTFSEFARYIITKEAKAIVKEENKTVITITHEPYLAKRANKQIYIVDGKLSKS